MYRIPPDVWNKPTVFEKYIGAYGFTALVAPPLRSIDHLLFCSNWAFAVFEKTNKTKINNIRTIPINYNRNKYKLKRLKK